MIEGHDLPEGTDPEDRDEGEVSEQSNSSATAGADAVPDQHTIPTGETTAEVQ